MLFIAKFKKPDDPNEPACADVIVDALDADGAVAAVRSHGIEDEVVRLVTIPAGVFCVEVTWADDDVDANVLDHEDLDIGENPANLSEAGVILEVSDRLGGFLELDANADGVIDTAQVPPVTP